METQELFIAADKSNTRKNASATCNILHTACTWPFFALPMSMAIKPNFVNTMPAAFRTAGGRTVSYIRQRLLPMASYHRNSRFNTHSRHSVQMVDFQLQKFAGLVVFRHFFQCLLV